MNVNSILAAMETTQPSPNRNASGGGGSEANMFMTLLVAQLKNQDPLQPQDGAAFVAQLAQFNSLDQLIGIRRSIEQLTVQIQQGQSPASSETN